MVGLKTYHQGRLEFVLTPTSIIIQTPLQAFYLYPKTHYWNKRMNLIRTMIELGEVRDLNELAGFCANGNISWIATLHRDFGVE